MRQFAIALGLAALAGCGGEELANETTANVTSELALGERDLELSGADGDDAEEIEVEDVGEAGSLPIDDEGWTPMARRVAVLGLLNKRNGTSREIELRPGQARRIGDVIVRLRACERTAPWEPQTLTGAFVQLDVHEFDTERREPRWRRVFSGWVYKERPALNVIRHRLYDVWPRSCEMTHGASAAPRNAESRSSDGASPAREPANDEEDSDAESAAPAPSPPPPTPPADSADPSIDT